MYLIVTLIFYFTADLFLLKISKIRLISIFFLYLFLSNCQTQEYNRSDHYDGSRFHNPNPVEPPSFYFVAKHILFGRNKEWIYDSLGIQEPSPVISNLDIENLSITWIGHATTLIQFGGKNILTDPVWSDTVGLFGFFGPNRAIRPGLSFHSLPKIDYVLISHDHYDHTDIPSLKNLRDKFDPIYIVPLGMLELLTEYGITKAVELDWWNTYQNDTDLQFHLTPAQHNSGRGLFDKNKRLWGSFVIEFQNYKIFFAGDTAYEDHFTQIYSRIGKIDISILPIGAYEPEEEMRKFHTSPKDSVQAFLDLQSIYLFPMHYATFNLTRENQTKPVEDLKKAIKSYKLSENKFLIQKPGEIWQKSLKELRNSN